MQIFNSFQEVFNANAPSGCRPMNVLSEVDIFNATYRTDRKLTPEEQAKPDNVVMSGGFRGLDNPIEQDDWTNLSGT